MSGMLQCSDVDFYCFEKLGETFPVRLLGHNFSEDGFPAKSWVIGVPDGHKGGGILNRA
jgi:hypothetical protein